MVRTQRWAVTAGVLVCILAIQGSAATLFAADDNAAAAAVTSSTATSPDTPRLVIDASKFMLADESTTFAQRRRFWGRGDRNEGARAAIVVGTIAAITGAALLVYANRPDCSSSPAASGCGYGTKVVGGAVLAAGAVGIVAGTVSWR